MKKMILISLALLVVSSQSIFGVYTKDQALKMPHGLSAISRELSNLKETMKETGPVSPKKFTRLSSRLSLIKTRTEKDVRFLNAVLMQLKRTEQRNATCTQQ